MQMKIADYERRKLQALSCALYKPMDDSGLESEDELMDG